MLIVFSTYPTYRTPSYSEVLLKKLRWMMPISNLSMKAKSKIISTFSRFFHTAQIREAIRKYT